MFKILATLSLLATAVSAQVAVSIQLPVAGQTVAQGSRLLVLIEQPDSLTGDEEVGVAIGLQSCPNSPCYPASGGLGTTLLYNGPFNPQFHTTGPPVPYENFTVQVPSTAPIGTAAIGVAHFVLVGAEYGPSVGTTNQTITIVPA